MITNKRVNSNLRITTTNTGGNITLATPDVYILGNIHVEGDYDTINVTNTDVKDRDLTLNAGETGAGVGGASPENAHIYIDRGTLGDAAIRWNESLDIWQISSNVDAGFGTLSSGGITAVVEDSSPRLGGNLRTNSFHISLNTPLVTPPQVESGNVLLYAGTINAGQSGLYIVNEAQSNQELITKTRAFGFSLIL
jgi:hypothetical protein